MEVTCRGSRVSSYPWLSTPDSTSPCASTMPFASAKPSPAPPPLKRDLLVECLRQFTRLVELGKDQIAILRGDAHTCVADCDLYTAVWHVFVEPGGKALPVTVILPSSGVNLIAWSPGSDRL